MENKSSLYFGLQVCYCFLSCDYVFSHFYFSQFPLPLPKGGRHSDNPVLTEDQPRGQHRLPRKKDNMNVFDPDYIARASPFAAKDVTSRASQLGYHLKGSQYQNRRNPNEVRKKSSRKKKRWFVCLPLPRLSRKHAFVGTLGFQSGKKFIHQAPDSYACPR